MEAAPEAPATLLNNTNPKLRRLSTMEEAIQSVHDNDSIIHSDGSNSSVDDATSTKAPQGGFTESEGSSSRDPQTLAEARRVRQSKRFVLAVIVLSCLVCAFATFWFTRNEQRDDFALHFSNVADEVVAISEQEAITTFGVVDSLAITVNSFALRKEGLQLLPQQQKSWPNMTLPHWEQRGQTNNRLSRAIQVSLAPLVRQTPDAAQAWEAYTQDNQFWIQQGVDAASPSLHKEWRNSFADPSTARVPPISPYITVLQEEDNNNNDEESKLEAATPTSAQVFERLVPRPRMNISTNNNDNGGLRYYAPLWQQSPAPTDPSIVNFNLLSHPVLERIYQGMRETGLPVLSEVSDWAFIYQGAVQDNFTEPHSALLYPIFDSLDATGYDLEFDFFAPRQEEIREVSKTNGQNKGKMRMSNDNNKNLVAFLVAILPWERFFVNLLPEAVRGVIVVLYSSCGDNFTYRLDGPRAIFVGEGDLHNPKYNSMKVTSEFAGFLNHSFSDKREHCEYDLRIYPSRQFELDAVGWEGRPYIYAVFVVFIFSFTAFVFLGYDFLVERRQKKVERKAKRSGAVVSALFPSNVRDRILRDAEEAILQADEQKKRMKNQRHTNTTNNLERETSSLFLESGGYVPAVPSHVNPFSTKPIADLFPSATVLFADIAMFTAWSSSREPSQVFSLLEAIYHGFDTIAGQRAIFKVETIGDCYVAVAGVPHARHDHAVVMARFARDCITKMSQVVKAMELALGPGTGDLAVRIGLHSGPVTAGVLRGEKARFQLFGDTVNTASRMESMGEPNRVQVSGDTANFLRAANKEHWLQPRSEVIHPKGKCKMQTYWLTRRLRSRPPSLTSQQSARSLGETSSIAVDEFPGLAEHTVDNDLQTKRLVRWNTDVMWRLIKEVVSHRNSTKHRKQVEPKNIETLWDKTRSLGKPSSLLDEVSDTIDLPYLQETDTSNRSGEQDSVDPQVKLQVFRFISSIANLYRNNHFHNFQHASHVTMSVIKLLSRITSAPVMEESDHARSLGIFMHEQTYGIASDPLTRFACVFAALIHDVDHTGLPNSQLIKEDSPLATLYENKSIAEQNSFHVAWELLMADDYIDLRNVLCETEDELTRFRQLVVNSVMATDVVDKDLVAVRNQRWEFAFAAVEGDEVSEKARWNRRATIVLDHLIQASDVSHTMQHWHVYRKWNELLFQEMYLAYKHGHAERDPASFWYQGELGFLDFYVIPLAKKLKDCGVFGVSSDEYLDYAVNNRQEWADKGKEVVAGMVEKYYEKAQEVSPKIF